MALPMVHLAVAYGYAEKYNKKALICPEYYLGAISPDSIHSRSNIGKDDKIKTHLNVKGLSLSESACKIVSFTENTSCENYMFYLGYGIHIMTDKIWVVFFRDNFPELTDSEGHTKSSLYYNDTDQVDFMLYKKLSMRPYLWELLNKAVSPNFENLLSASEIEAWKQRNLNYFKNKVSIWTDPIKYLTYEAITGFIETAPCKLNEMLCYDENFIH